MVAWSGGRFDGRGPDLNSDPDGEYGALVRGARMLAGMISPVAGSPGAAGIAGIRSLLPGSGSAEQEFARYNEAAGDQGSVLDRVALPGEDRMAALSRQATSPAMMAEAMNVASMAAPIRVGPGVINPKGSAAYDEALSKWFGGSKVVDEAGRPATVYKAMYPRSKEYGVNARGEPVPEPGLFPPGEGPPIDVINRPSPFPAFDLNEGQWEGVKIAGFFGDKKTANYMADGMGSGAIFPAHLSFQKPFVIDGTGKFAGETQFGSSGKPFRDAIRSGEYDSVIIKNTKDEGTVYVALRPEQIKSAIGNRGTFDPTDPRITMGLVGAAGLAAEVGTEDPSITKKPPK
jgi:hypothetical protein